MRQLGPKTSKWDEIADENRYLESEELMLRNTFLNAQNGPMAQLSNIGPFSKYPRLRLLKWQDMCMEPSSTNSTRGKYQQPTRQRLAVMTDPRKDLINLGAVLPQVNHRRQIHQKPVTPIIRKARSQNDISTLYPSMYTKKPAPSAQLRPQGGNSSHDFGSSQPHQNLQNDSGKPPPRSGSMKTQPRKAIPINPTPGDL